ncbi:MAG TPA: hypothetical protein VN238_14635, partial [Solirubrobacteraceae bacterium]|nr:hypothetical protein [Solirubrobacteraceae bacterium]
MRHRPLPAALVVAAALAAAAPSAVSAAVPGWSIEPPLTPPSSPEIIAASADEQRLVATQGDGAVV